MGKQKGYSTILKVESEDTAEFTGPSKSQKKRDMHALQALGEKLPKLPKAMWERLALPDILHDAVQSYVRITAFEGKRRQLQLLGKLMRRLDEPTVAALKLHFSEDRERFQVATARLHELEHWRDRLIKEDQAFSDLCLQYPSVVRNEYHQLIRAARGPVGGRQATAARTLYQTLKLLFENQITNPE